MMETKDKARMSKYLGVLAIFSICIAYHFICPTILSMGRTEYLLSGGGAIHWSAGARYAILSTCCLLGLPV